ncbi:MAG: hypothetical protein D6726_08685 [Nitrospirae bacterium]|nr:MAG: hypothetical protein D6726_08685 [Nitrospirota bacterium]
MRKIDHIAEVVQSKFRAWEDARSEKTAKWEQYYRLWRCIESEEDKTRSTERSKIKIPATKGAIDAAFDNIYSMIFSRTPFFDVEGRTVEWMPRAEIIKQYLSYLFYKQKFPSQYAMFIKEMLLYGTGIGMVEITRDVVKHIEKRPRFDFAGLQIGSVVEVVEKEVIRPRFQPISIFDFFIDPSTEGIQEGEGCIVRSRKFLHELRAKQRKGIISGVEFLEDNGHTGDMDDELEYRLGIGGMSNIGTDKRKVVLDYWGWMDEEDLEKAGYEGEIEDGGAEVHAIVCDGVCLKLAPNPLVTKERPFVKDCFEEIPGEFYGIGIAEICEGPQRALDATVRARLDNKAIAINQIFGINVKRLVPGQDLKVYPGKTFLVEGPVREAIEQFRVADVTSGTYQEAIEYERYIQEASGISKSLGGLPVKRGEMSATESQYIQAQQGMRIRALVKNMEDNSLREIIRLYYQIILQFLDIPEVIKVTGENGESINLTISPESIAGDYEFIPLGTVALNEQDKVNKLIQFLGMTANPVDAQLVNRPLLLRKVYEGIFGSKDVDIAIRPVPQDVALMNAGNIPNTGSPPAMPDETGVPNG